MHACGSGYLELQSTHLKPYVVVAGVSMLERLMQNGEPYQKPYDAKYVTKLLRSFRSHPAILDVPNALFYDGELQACADKLEREKFCNWQVSRTYNCVLYYNTYCG